MKFSAVTLAVAAIAGISAMPVPNRAAGALGGRASAGIGSLVNFFPRGGNLIVERDPSALPAVPRKLEYRAVGRTVSLPVR